MTEAPVMPKTGAEDVIWDLSVLYAGIDDPQINADLETLRQVQRFVELYRGKVAQLSAAELHSAMNMQLKLASIQVKLLSYASLNFTTFSTDARWGAFMQRIQEEAANISQQAVFFDLE